jgi:hypothetical protein
VWRFRSQAQAARVDGCRARGRGLAVARAARAAFGLFSERRKALYGPSSHEELAWMDPRVGTGGSRACGHGERWLGAVVTGRSAPRPAGRRVPAGRSPRGRTRGGRFRGRAFPAVPATAGSLQLDRPELYSPTGHDRTLGDERRPSKLDTAGRDGDRPGGWLSAPAQCRGPARRGDALLPLQGRAVRDLTRHPRGRR